MKKEFLFISCFLISAFCSVGQVSKSDELAEKMSKRMYDSVGVTDKQREDIKAVNLKLDREKMAWRRRFAETDSLAKYFQIVENTRDSLYRGVLSNEQYAAYLKRKDRIVKN